MVVTKATHSVAFVTTLAGHGLRHRDSEDLGRAEAAVAWPLRGAHGANRRREDNELGARDQRAAVAGDRARPGLRKARAERDRRRSSRQAADAVLEQLLQLPAERSG